LRNCGFSQFLEFGLFPIYFGSGAAWIQKFEMIFFRSGTSEKFRILLDPDPQHCCKEL